MRSEEDIDSGRYGSYPSTPRDRARSRVALILAQAHRGEEPRRFAWPRYTLLALATLSTRKAPRSRAAPAVWKASCASRSIASPCR